MILNIESKKLILSNKINNIIIPNITKEKITKYWEKFLNNNPNCYNGDVYTATKIVKDKDKINIELGKIKYEDLIYNKKYPFIKTRSIFVASYFITKDNKYCIIKNNHDVIDLIGGMVDTKDFSNNTLIPLNTLTREIKEELGLDINSPYFISKELKYLKYPNNYEEKNIEFTIGIIYEVKLNITSKELINIFKKNHNIIDGEIKEIITISKYNDLIKYIKTSRFIKKLFKKIIKKKRNT